MKFVVAENVSYGDWEHRPLYCKTKLEPLNLWIANIRFIKYTYETKQIKKKELKTAK